MSGADRYGTAAQFIGGFILTALELGILGVIVGLLNIKNSYPYVYSIIEHFRIWAAFGGALVGTLGIGMIAGGAVGVEFGGRDSSSYISLVFYVILFLILWGVGVWG